MRDHRALALLGLLWVGAFHVVLAQSAQRDVDRSETVRRLSAGVPNQSLWSADRVRAWKRALTLPAAPPLAVLRIPSISLEAPILSGTDDQTLDRGVGHVDETALPGTDGNMGLAGHRDSFFRGLKNLKSGALLQLDTPGGRERYRVERIWIVDPEDVSVLEPTQGRAITLVTCYPFYFVGNAPRRFIVRAVFTGVA